ncbi:MAG: Fic family protein, partial [Gammaproteobacteria bacterium]|nr:Fic family protein [Gammaproteobacteria bacterium]NIR95816.1 Fic family protein [Gammaproteobacteria bacterium]NIW39953.1 cell filamentation protein Fic [candidate division Zixibacteria bacterium]NIX58382.1 cell filamentation protein Fic [candidate division Zixibacteria bacterium]
MIDATDSLFHKYDIDHRFSANDICHMHKIWLGDIYEWAGCYRSVNISKDDFAFAMAARIHGLMDQFEKNQLDKYTPCNFSDR